MATISIDELVWDEFIIQSRRQNTNASQRIREFIVKELQKSKQVKDDEVKEEAEPAPSNDPNFIKM